MVGVVANLSGDEKRKIITIEDMSKYLPKAYVAIEDERFEKHHGVDWKRTAGAIFNTVFKGSSSYGGSTITQQLVKNLTKDDESSGLAGIYRKNKRMGKSISSRKNDFKRTNIGIIFKYIICRWRRKLTWGRTRSRVLF